MNRLPTSRAAVLGLALVLVGSVASPIGVHGATPSADVSASPPAASGTPVLTPASSPSDPATPAPSRPSGTATPAAGAIAASAPTLPAVMPADVVGLETTISIDPAPNKNGQVGPYVRLIGWPTYPAPDPGNGVDCQLDDGPWQPCDYNAYLHFSGVAAGDHSARARAHDGMGNVDSTPAETTFNVETIAPVGGPVVIDGGATVVGRLDWHLDLPGTDADGIAYVDVSTAPPDANGNLDPYHTIDSSPDVWANAGVMFHYAWFGSADPGLKTIWVQWVDTLGNGSAIESASVIYDPAASPTSAWDLHAARSHSPLGSPVWLRGRLSASDGVPIPSGEVTITVAGHPEWSSTSLSLEASAGGSGMSFLPMTAGTYTVTYRYLGGGGVQPSTASIDVVVGPELDMRAPDTWVGVGPPTPADASRWVVVSSGDRAASFECQVDAGAWVACDAAWTTPSLSGTHVVSVRSVSAAGVRDPSPARVALWFGAAVSPGYLTTGSWEYSVKRQITVYWTSTAGDVDTVRFSDAPGVDAQGMLVEGADTTITPGTVSGGIASWDLEDPAMGGVAGDGGKPFYAQWRHTDGTWTPVVANTIILDTTSPHPGIVIADGAGFVDADQLFVLFSTDESASIQYAFAPDGPWQQVLGSYVQDVAIPVDIAPVAPGTVATVTVYVRAGDMYSNGYGTTSASVVIDRTRPTATATAPSFVVGSRVTATSVQLRIAGRTSDTGSGIKASAIQTSVNGASFHAAASSTSTTVATTVSFVPSRVLDTRVRGVDRLGHIGSWAIGPGVRPVLYSDASRVITYRGWSAVASTAALGGAMHRTSKAGATAVIRFSGRAIALVAPESASLGRFSVIVDGKAIGTVDLRRTSTRARTVVWKMAWSVSGPHVIVLKALGTAGRPTVALDGLVVLR